jgi:uncharacterized membrane protein YdjX (TVP38/TMEM64 family)
MMRMVKSYRFWLAIFFVAFIIFLRITNLTEYISLAKIQEKRLELMQFVLDHYVLSVMLFIVMYIFIVVTALPIAGLSTVMSGFLFGVIPGVIYSNIGATVGATLFFLIIRHLFGNALQKRYEERLTTINEYMHRYGIFYLIALRFIATIPFSIENTLFAMTKVSLWTFIWTTVIGILPGSIVYAYAGKQLATITSMRDIFSLGMLLAFGFLALLALTPIVIHYYWRKWHAS